jgi:succinoglycan biosynthesis protein ExoV
MKLYYFKAALGNFGDDLNPWLWSRLIPDLLDDDAEELFVGIGTLLNHRLPPSRSKQVFGSGYGYGEKPHIDAGWTFHAVRGPHTAEALGLPADRAVCDSAILLREVERRRGGRSNGPVGLILTGQTIGYFDWAPLCVQQGIRFINCHDPVERTLEALLDCRTVLCEAMHGAIVCDALRIPWVPVRCTPDVLALKWKDWLATVNLRYEPTDLPKLHRPSDSLARTLKHGALRLLRHRAAAPAPSRPAQVAAAADELAAAARRSPYLSDERCIQALTECLAERLQQLRQSRRP